MATHVANTQCLHAPPNPTVNALISMQVLLPIAPGDSLFVITTTTSPAVTLTASSAEEGEALKALGATTIGSWRYQAPVLTIHRGINPETHIIDRLEFNPQTACFAR